ncbi:MAG: DegT/DnrJ/EryC1/StrS family aminotransferase [Verrucomicrobiae bacterium]|nr:DegT/DnrJ/EryC1/StrS family aminotransferase [Verrucomicrobiae bacterium]
MHVPFLNPGAQVDALKSEILHAIGEVLSRGRFVLGPEVDALEQEVAALCGARFGVGVNSGSDALTLALRALGVGPGDEVITSPFTYIAPAESIHQLGARPVFADIHPRWFTLDPAAVARRLSARTRAIVPVHLFGQAAPLRELEAFGLPLVEDCAQAIGATCERRPVGSWGVLGCLSFYPTKNLGACGDGGMVLTRDEGLARRLRMLRVHGIERRYHHDLHGWNSRLDELQAAILRVKLPHLAAWNARRAALAARYTEGLSGLPLELPETAPGNTHIFHVYAVLTDRRDALQQHLADHGVPTLIYYPLPLHLQPCFADLGGQKGDLPVAEAVCRRVLPLPMYPELEDAQADWVIAQIRGFFGR